MKKKENVVTYVTRQGSLLFDVILYIIAAAVVIASIYFGISALKTQADVSSVTSNDMKVLMNTANSFKNGFYNSNGKYKNLTPKNSKAWSTLELDSTKSFYLSSKFDNECKYSIHSHDNNATTPTHDARYGIYIDCTTAMLNQNWSPEKTYQIELAYANAIKTRIPDAIIVAGSDAEANPFSVAGDVDVAYPGKTANAPDTNYIETQKKANLLVYNLFE